MEHEPAPVVLGFDQWLAEVDRLIGEAFDGVGHEDLPDQPYRDWHAAGVAPASAVRKVLGMITTDEMLASLGALPITAELHAIVMNELDRRLPPQEHLPTVRQRSRDQLLLADMACIIDTQRLCDFAHPKPTLATVDGKTKNGPWANMCDEHYDMHGVGLGLGRGQLLLGHEPV